MRFFTIILFSLCLSLGSNSQSNSLNKEIWENQIEGTNYFEEGYAKKPVEESSSESVDFDDLDSGDKQKKESEDTRESKHRSSSGSNIPAWLSTFLMILIIGLLLFFIVSTILKNPGTGSNKTTGSGQFTEEDIEDIEGNPFENDLERYIYEAKQAENYKLALRFSFIYIIRLLAENGDISWKKDKTNHQYYVELSGNNFQGAFHYMKLVYETVWYGDFDLNKSNLDKSLMLFENHINSLKNKKQAS